MGQAVFSIIIPVYNAEKYLDKAIKSVLSQSFGDWQLLLVDDCSTDSSLSICKDYANKDLRIEVVALENNMGAGNARNKGITCAKGKYITFMDADDYLEANVFENVWNVLKRRSAKLTVVGIVEEYYNEHDVIIDSTQIMPIETRNLKAYNYAAAGDSSASMEVSFLSNRDEVRTYIIELENSTLYGYLWNKFYEAEYLIGNGFQLDDQPLLEDARFNISYAMDIDSMNLVNIAAYHYCKRASESLTSKYVKDYFDIHKNHVEELFDQQMKWGQTDSKVREILGNIYGRYIISTLQRNFDQRAGLSHKDRKVWLKTVYHDDLYNELIPFGSGNGLINNILMSVLKSKIIWMNLAVGGFIHLVKNKLPNIFAKARKHH